MFGLFFDRSGSKQQSPQNKPQDHVSRYSKSPPNNTYTEKVSYSPRITSLSPSHTNNVSNSNTNVSPSKHQYSPKSSATPTTFYIPKSITNKDYKGPVLTANKEDQTLNKTTKDNTTAAQGSYLKYNPTEFSPKNTIKTDKPKPKLNFEFCPLDKESFSQNMGSVSENTLEGTLLTQILPQSKNVSATKIPPSTLKYQPMTLGDRSGARPKTQTKDGKLTEFREAPAIRQTTSDKPPATIRKTQNVVIQDPLAEKKKINQEFLNAVKHGNLAICKELLDKKKGELKANVNSKGENDWTALHFASLSGNAFLVELLIYNEANIEAETTLKFTPLIIASQKGHKEIVQRLINAGADINCTDIYQNTPLHYASQNAHKSLVELLLQRPSVDLSKKNNENKTAFQLARNEDIKGIFSIYITEKSLLDSKYNQKVQIHHTKNEQVKKMFGNVGFRPESTSPLTKKTLSDNSELEAKNQKVCTSESNNMSPSTKDMKISTTSQSGTDSEVSSNTQGPSTGCEDEKIGPQSFVVHSLIGKGSFGEVYLVERKSTKEIFAMKVLHKSKILKQNLIKYALTERNVLCITNHPFIVKLHYAFQTSDKLLLILDYCPGGDLGEHLQRERRFSEEKARIYLAEIILALEDLHKRDIIFRDLKPDNIVLDSEGHALLTDFGLSKEGVYEHNQGAKSFCGSVAYLAPEMLKRVGHGKAVDWYLLGVVFYEMLVGIPPYYANNREQLFQNIEKAPLKIPSFLSNEAKALLKGLLQRNPAKRLGSSKGDGEEIKSHKFFEGIDWSDVEKRKLKPPVPEKKMKLNQAVALNVLENYSGVNSDKDHINGWSFIAQGDQESLKVQDQAK